MFTTMPDSTDAQPISTSCSWQGRDSSVSQANCSAPAARGLRNLLRSISFLSVASIAVACSDGGSEKAPDASILPAVDAASDTDASTILSPLRFVLSVNNDVPESIYVQLSGEGGGASWVGVSQDGVPVILHERCEVLDCVNPGGICGVGEPRVKDITGGTATGSITLMSDGRMSVVDSVLECETMEPLPDGSYTATFCWALSAEFEGNGDPTSDGGAAGRVITPSCTDVSFAMPGDGEVSYTITGG